MSVPHLIGLHVSVVAFYFGSLWQNETFHSVSMGVGMAGLFFIGRQLGIEQDRREQAE